jgi:CubicO group peptidase (beta-lactamase class C family)
MRRSGIVVCVILAASSAFAQSTMQKSMMEVGYGHFNNALLEEMRDSDSPDAIYVINLLLFKSQAAYADGRTTGLTGEEAYELYSSAGHPQRFGGDLVHSTQISTTMTGSEVSGGSSTWDRVEITRYPSRARYVAMYDDAGYQTALVHKDAGLETAIVMVSELTMSSTWGELPPEMRLSSPQAIHLGELLKFRETAKYDPQQEPARSGKDADVLYEKLVVRPSIVLRQTEPVGNFSIEGVLVGDGRTWDEFKLSQFPSREGYDDWETGSRRQGGLVHREAGMEDSLIMVSEPPTVNRLPEISAAQPWRWDTKASISAEYRAMQFARDTIDPEDIFYEHNGVRRSIAEYITRASAAGLMVIHDGTVVLEHYGLGIGPESRCHVFSSIKSFVSTLVGMAVHEGKIASLDDKVSLYAPQFENTAYGDTSIRHLLMMSSGIDFFYFGSEPTRKDYHWDVVNQGMSIDDWIAALPRRVPAGTDFNYIMTDTHALSAVLRAVYDMPLAKILETKLWQPAGFAGDATWGQDQPGADGHAHGGIGLSLRLQEFAHLGQFYLEDLMIDGQQTVPADWVDSVAQPQVGDNYSLQFWLPRDSDREFYSAGAFGNYCWIDKARGFTVAQFATQVSWQALSKAEFFAAMRALGDAVTGVTR